MTLHKLLNIHVVSSDLCLIKSAGQKLAKRVSLLFYYIFLKIPYGGNISTIIINSFPTMDQNANFVFDLETGNVEGKGQRRGLQWKVLKIAYTHVKFERLIMDSCPTMDLNANLHLTLKEETLKVKVKKTMVAIDSAYYDITCEDCKTYHNIFLTMGLNVTAYANC